PPSSFHQPEGIGVGKAPATGCCTPGGNSPQLLKKIATAVRGRSLTSWIDFMKRGRYAASLRRSTATLHWTLVPYANPRYATKFKPIILFRQTLVTAAAFAFAVTAGQVRAENSFLMGVIDPGHGGSDPGGIPGQIVPEKTVALDTALRLQKLLQRAGLRTVMTRSTDIFVPLSVRSAIADAERDA